MVSGEGRDCAGVIGILSDSKPIKQEEDGDREIEREGGGGESVMKRKLMRGFKIKL